MNCFLWWTSARLGELDQWQWHDGGVTEQPAVGHRVRLASDVETASDLGEEGGDSACWLERVCSQCGALPDGAPLPTCERCGQPRAEV